ncbi:Gfo/Idh/MocA family protein [Azospirillum picis]|uniref:D-galactose 1-dehydrogenase n=1 Tax=Azospirillum picis TaxID=488438 RepID=A0ABU0MJ37_9PROT|nr:Gfo/Idh/MocA family oxidoreductase [Azospirillum picis]MBP2299686.1 D-galactose 1-dehydrogenase [Azospirillum picis]MDQ0533482.1 D-galactose 1-dehydrogenase [Azospirillum picis]
MTLPTPGLPTTGLPTLGLVGLGKIARDQHIPAIAATGLFELAAVVSPDGDSAGTGGVPCFRSQAEMLAALPGLDAMAICTPPAVRHGLTVEALRAGKHVLIEKPPAATLSEMQDIAAQAQAARRTLLTAWHSRFNPAVEEARQRLADATVRSVAITWKEDVRRWHPGQDWIFAAGGFGVFDPGINALSILTAVLPAPVFVRSAELHVPANRDTPIRAMLEMRAAPGAPVGVVTADFDFLQQGEQTWSIAIETADGSRLDLTHGGTRLIVDGVPAMAEPDSEYQRIYRHFHRLMLDGASDIDARPLHLVADACLVGRWRTTDAFHW